MHTEYFIVFDDGARAVVYGRQSSSRQVPTGQYAEALTAKGRSSGLVGWRKRSSAERHAKIFYIPIKIVELEVA